MATDFAATTRSAAGPEPPATTECSPSRPQAPRSAAAFQASHHSALVAFFSHSACRSILTHFIFLAPPQPDSEFLRNAGEESAARSVLRREHADARAIPDLVDLVEHVDDVEPHR